MTSLSQIRTFFNLPRIRLSGVEPPAAAIFGVASSIASAFGKAENGTYFLRNMSKAYAWQADETAIIDLRRQAIGIQSMVDGGDVGGTTQEALSGNIAEAVRKLSSATVPVFVGGDHSITHHVLQGLLHRNERPLFLISFDHHLDMQYWKSGRDALFNTNVMSHVGDLLGPGRIVHIGVNPMQSVPKGRRAEFISDLAWIGTQIPLGSAALQNDRQILEAIGEGENVYISVDVDVLHRNEMSATGYPSDQGMSLERLLSVIELIASHNSIVGCDLVEFVADRSDRSVATLADAGRATRILLSLLLAIAAQSVEAEDIATSTAQPTDASLLSGSASI